MATPKLIESLLIGEPILSTFLVHLTRDYGGLEGRENLLSIMTSFVAIRSAMNPRQD